MAGRLIPLNRVSAHEHHDGPLPRFAIRGSLSPPCYPFQPFFVILCRHVLTLVALLDRRGFGSIFDDTQRMVIDTKF